MNKFKSAILALLVALVAVACAGCASVGHPINQDKMSQIKRGTTTRTEVETLLGKPANVSVVDGPSGKKTILSYVYIYSSVKGTAFIPYAGMFMGGANTTTQNASITLDANDVVESVASNTGKVEARSNAEAQTPAK